MLNSTDRLTDSEKFVVILQKYAHEYSTQKELAEEMGIPKQSISDWKKNARTIRINNRNSISKTFQLKDMIWIDSFDDAVNFEEQLDNYRISVTSKRKQSNKHFTFVSQNIILPIQEISKKEKKILANFNQVAKIEIENLDLTTMSSASLFELSLLLKSTNQINEGLKILESIQKKEGSFKYSNHNKISHLKAIFLSHEDVQDWDKSIDILRLLYVANYHREEPEIITLLASNYKRKALYCFSSKQKKLIKNEQIDLNLLSSALLLYREAYEAKDSEPKYYDAINFAYLYKIVECIESEEPNSFELKNLYKSLKQEWVVDSSNWWEVSTNVEFLMLLGETELAKHNITMFLEEQRIESFNIETTLRQLKLYLHFTKDSNAKELHDYLYESWQHINV